MAMKIKVSVSSLIEKVEAAKARAVKEHEKALVKWEAAVSAYPQKVVEALDAALRDVAQGKLPTTESVYRSGQGGYRTFLAVPLTAAAAKAAPDDKPTLSVDRFDRDLSILRMASVTELAISVDDSQFGKYL